MNQIKILYILFPVLLLSCRDIAEGTYVDNTDEGEVQIGVSTRENLQPYGNGIEYENDINQLDLLIFSADHKFKYRKESWLSGSVYKANLKIEDNIHIYFAANMRALLQEAEQTFLTQDASWDDIHTQLIDTSPERLIGGTTYLPMWGRLQNANVREGIINNLNVYNNNQPIPLIRSVASVDVAVLEDPDVFTLTEAYLYYSPDKGYLSIDNDNYKDTGKEVNTPRSPGNMKTIRTFTSDLVTDNNIKEKMYIYDNPSQSVTPERRYTRLVLGGYYNSVLTYYPLDFHDGTDLYQLTRNCKYFMTITSVNGEGYKTPGEASEAAPVNMDFEVIQWNMKDDSDIGIDGPDYLSVGKKKVILYNSPFQPVRITLKTTYLPEDVILELEKGTQVDLNAIGGFEDELGMQNEQFRVRLITDQDKITHLEFTALNYWNSSHNTDKLTITAGRIEFEVEIEQLSYDPNDWLVGDETIVGKDDEDDDE